MCLSFVVLSCQFSSAVSIACFFNSYNWNHSLLNIPMLYAANTSKLVKYNEQASETGHFHTKKELATLFIVPPVPYLLNNFRL